MFVDQRSQSLNLCTLAHVVKWKLEILGWKAWGEDKVNNAEAGGEVKCLKYLERERGRLSGTDCHERGFSNKLWNGSRLLHTSNVVPWQIQSLELQKIFSCKSVCQSEWQGARWLPKYLDTGQFTVMWTLRLCMTRWKPMCRHSLLHSMLLQQVPDWKLELLDNFDNFDISSFRSCWGVIEDDPDHFMIINP